MKDKKMNDFLNLVSYIIRKPGMFNVNELDDLYFIMLGYRLGNTLFGEELASLLNDFSHFVSQHYELERDHEWVGLIKLYGGSDTNCIALFERLFSQYLASIGTEWPSGEKKE